MHPLGPENEAFHSSPLMAMPRVPGATPTPCVGVPLGSRTARRQGAVLVLVLVALVLAATLTAEIFFSAQAAGLESQARLAQLRRRLALRSALLAATAILDDDAHKTRFDSPDEPWAKRQEIVLGATCRVSFQLADEEAKVNLNRIAWRDPAGHPTPEGRRATVILAGLGVNLREKELAALLPLHDLASLAAPEQRSVRLVYADSGSGANSLRRHFTVAGSGRVNVNTASRETLSVLFEAHLVDRLLRERNRKPLASLAVVRNWSGVDPRLLAQLEARLTVVSAWFSALFVAEDAAGRSRALAVFERSDGGTRLRHWKEL